MNTIKQASDEGRLFLARTIGPLSGGTRVKLLLNPPSEYIYVMGFITNPPKSFRPNPERILVEVPVDKDDLVIRRSRCI